MVKKLVFITALFFAAFCFPPAYAEDAGLISSLNQSDDYGVYSEAFFKASMDLIEQGTCALEDFEEVGGWLKSINHKPKPIYFTYCGGMTVSNRVYLNAKTGEVFR